VFIGRHRKAYALELGPLRDAPPPNPCRPAGWFSIWRRDTPSASAAAVKLRPFRQRQRMNSAASVRPFLSPIDGQNRHPDHQAIRCYSRPHRLQARANTFASRSGLKPLSRKTSSCRSTVNSLPFDQRYMERIGAGVTVNQLVGGSSPTPGADKSKT
jgi:hypothetical protein